MGLWRAGCGETRTSGPLGGRARETCQPKGWWRALVRPNRPAWAIRDRFASCHDYLQTTVEGQFIVCFHYAMRVWNKSHRGAWHLYGHSHGSLADDPHALSMDVGVDCNDFYPFSFEEVAQHMRTKEYRPVDHHKPWTA